MNISDREVLISLAKKTGLDIDRFISDFDGGLREKEVLADYEDGQFEYQGWVVPLAIIGDCYPYSRSCSHCCVPTGNRPLPR